MGKLRNDPVSRPSTVAGAVEIDSLGSGAFGFSERKRWRGRGVTVCCFSYT